MNVNFDNQVNVDTSAARQAAATGTQPAGSLLQTVTLTADQLRQLKETLQKAVISNAADEQEAPALFSIYGIDVLPRQTVALIAAQKKSGKTNFAGLLLSAAAAPDRQVLGGAVCCKIDRAEEARVLVIDTEQPVKDFRRTLRRVMKTIGYGYDEQWADHGIVTISVKDCDEAQRRMLIELAAREYRPQMLIIDGIADLLPSINDEVASKGLMAWLDYLACQHDCAVVGMLHQNHNSDKVGGWAGTQAGKKVTDSFTLTKNAEGGYFTVTHEGRGQCAPKLSFRITCPPGDNIGWWESFADSIPEMTDEDRREQELRELADAAPLPCSNTVLTMWLMQQKHCSRAKACRICRECKERGLLATRREGRKSVWFKPAADAGCQAASAALPFEPQEGQ